MGERWWGRVPWGFLVAVLVIARVESAVGRRALELSRVEGIDWRLSGEMASRQAPGRDLLCFGSSMMAHGMLAGVLEQRTGRSAQNLAVAGGNLVSSYACLDRALRAGARPRAVLLEVHPAALTRSYRHNETIHVNVLDPRGALGLAWENADPHFLAQYLAERVLPSLHLRHDVRSAVVAALQGQPQHRIAANLILTRHRRANRGSSTHPRKEYRGEVAEGVRFDWLDDPALRKISPEGLWLLDRFLTRAKEAGLPVYWVIFPLAPGLQQLREGTAVEASYLDVARRALARYSNLVVIDGRRSGDDLALYHDAVHLNPWGAAAVSRGVASVMGRAPGAAATRWVDLPRLEDAPLEVTLEFPDESLRLLQENDRRSRR